MDVIEFIFSSFWHWLGTAALVYLVWVEPISIISEMFHRKKISMAYVAVDKDGSECIFARKPYRSMDWEMWDPGHQENNFNFLPKGMIKKMIGRPLTWEDEPVELKEE